MEEVEVVMVGEEEEEDRDERTWVLNWIDTKLSLNPRLDRGAICGEGAVACVLQAPLDFVPRTNDAADTSNDIVAVTKPINLRDPPFEV